MSFNGHPTGIAGQRDNQRVINATRTRFAPPPAADQPYRGSATTLCLGGGRFKAQVDWFSQYDNSGGVGRALPRTGSSGFFSFSDPSNIELMVKVLDFGDTVKVFYGQLTDLNSNCPSMTRGRGDRRPTTKRPTTAAESIRTLFREGRHRQVGAYPSPAAVPGRTRSARRRIVSKSVDWRNPGNGQAGQAGAAPLSQLNGAFYFTDKNSLELMTKIIDQGDRVDFFYGTLTDLEYTITVTDTATGAVKTYRNPAGRYCGGLEVDAF